ncbi:MAG: HU family DNA-binding protein, partial [Desulfatitalea sp.]|nr:HU family DNA-binding protein [Desulfatitalea sp.]
PSEHADACIRAIFAAMAEALAAGQEVRLHGFGKLFTRNRRASAAVPGRGVAFKGFDRLIQRLGDSDAAVLDALALTPPVDRRSSARAETFQDGTAFVRISGIPVCEFKLKSISEGGGSFLVPNDAFILRNIRVGLEIDIRLRQENGAAMQRARIVHITPTSTEELGDCFILGVQILTRLPV